MFLDNNVGIPWSFTQSHLLKPIPGTSKVSFESVTTSQLIVAGPEAKVFSGTTFPVLFYFYGHYTGRAGEAIFIFHSPLPKNWIQSITHLDRSKLQYKRSN